MTSPDHGCARAAQGRQGGHGRLDVLVADVAEHPADQEHHRWRDARVRVRDPGVSLRDLDTR